MLARLMFVKMGVGCLGCGGLGRRARRHDFQCVRRVAAKHGIDRGPAIEGQVEDAVNEFGSLDSTR